MRKKLLAIIVILLSLLLSTSCTKGSSYFSIQFIDVGQGDSALVECDGQYMLIDGGDTFAGNKVYRVLEEKNIQHLDILAISHTHQDHYGGLIKALTYASSIDVAIINSTSEDKKLFDDLKHELAVNGAELEVPHEGKKYKLGSANIEVVDVASGGNNSLVLLITYGKTRFLFTGDIPEERQRKIQSKYENSNNEPYKINVLKMPHHGDKILIHFIEVFDPDYAIISVGKDNQYGHPSKNTLHLLDQAEVKVFQTDLNGDIFVKSDGTTVEIKTEK